MPKYTVVDRLSDCERTVEALEREGVIAVDSEGVHLSKTGPLTLLQIGRNNGRVYLFDVMREPRMFKQGGLQRLLENDSVVKVLHSAKNDAEALYHQHGVQLHNVHDTQVAHMELQREEGVKFPPQSKLSNVCAVYCPEKVSLVDDDKNIITTKMNRTEGELWAKRPLTQEMIDYAASDVIALIPEMYTTQTRLLKEKRLTRDFQTRVERQLQAVTDSDVKEQLLKEKRDLAVIILTEFAKSAARRTQLQDITDQNVVDALSALRLTELPELGLPASIRDLKLQDIQNKMDEIEHDLQSKGKDYDAHSACKCLQSFVQILEDGTPLKEQAQRLQNSVHTLILQDIQIKYTASTPPSHIAFYEKKVLSRALRPKGEHDPSVHPVLLKLYWKVKLEDLEDTIQRFREDKVNFKTNEGYAKLLRFYVSGSVPAKIKEQARILLDALENMGKVSRPARSARGGRGGFGGGQYGGRRY